MPLARYIHEALLSEVAPAMEGTGKEYQHEPEAVNQSSMCGKGTVLGRVHTE
jgi:hypothetical protein